MFQLKSAEFATLLAHPDRHGAECCEVKEIVSGMALATGIAAQCFPMRSRRLAPCRSLREGLTSQHSARGRWGFGDQRRVLNLPT